MLSDPEVSNLNQQQISENHFYVYLSLRDRHTEMQTVSRLTNNSWPHRTARNNTETDRQTDAYTGIQAETDSILTNKICSNRQTDRQADEQTPDSHENANI